MKCGLRVARPWATALLPHLHSGACEGAGSYVWKNGVDLTVRHWCERLWSAVVVLRA